MYNAKNNNEWLLRLQSEIILMELDVSGWRFPKALANM